jgi:hypothetical protein
MPFRPVEDDEPPRGFRPVPGPEEATRGFRPVAPAASVESIRSLQEKLQKRTPSKNPSYQSGFDALARGDKAQALADWRALKPGQARYEDARKAARRLESAGETPRAAAPRSADSYRLALEAFQRGDGRAAEKLAARAVEEDPSHVEAARFLERARGGARAAPAAAFPPAAGPEPDAMDLLLGLAGETSREATENVFRPAMRLAKAKPVLLPGVRVPGGGELEREAARTGRVDYAGAAARAAADAGLEFILPDTTEGALIQAAAGPALRGAGAAGKALYLDEALRPLAAAARRRMPTFFGKQAPPAAAEDETTAALLGVEPAPPPAAAAAASGADDEALRLILAPESAGRIPPAAPVFESAAQRERLIREAILKREGGRVRRRLEGLKAKAERIRDIRAGKAGAVPEDAARAAEELRLIERDAVAELEETAKIMHKEAREASGGATTLEEFVMERGGLRAYRLDPRTGKPVEAEEWSDLPKRFRARGGRGAPPDVAAQDAYEAGLLDQPSDTELLRRLRLLPAKGKAEPWRAYLPEAEHVAGDPESALPLARRYLELRSKTAGAQLPGLSAGSGKGLSEAELRREMEKLAAEWEQKRARLSVKAGKAGPDVVGVDEDGIIAAPEMAGNVRVSKFPGEDVRFKIRQAAEELGWQAGQPYGGPRSFEETAAMADRLLAKGVRAKDMLKLPRGTALNDSEMRAMQVLTDDAFRKAQKAEDLASAAAGRPEAAEIERRAAEAWDEAKAVLDRLSEFKTTSGRAMAIQKAMSPDAIDLPTAYMQKVAESAPARRLTGQERAAFLRDEYARFSRLPKEEQLLLFEKEQGLSSFEEFRRNWIKPTLNMWRASLVSQLMTAMRNFSSQTGAALWNVLDDAVAASLGAPIRMLRGEAPRDAFRKASAGLVEDFTAFFRRFSREDRHALDDILENFPDLKEQLLGRFSHIEPQPAGTTLGAQKYGTFVRKYGDYLTWLSRWGEKKQRLYFFEAGLRERIRRSYPELLKTMDLKNLPFQQFRDVAQMAADAADHSMRLTFSKEFRDGVAGGFLKALRMPVIEELSALGGLTFPRFMANAYSWLWRHGPGIGLVETLMTPAGRRGLATGSPEAMKAVAGSVTGTMALGAALYARSRPETADGARWYELKLGQGKDGKPRYVNTLAYSPLIAPYLFMAELGLRGTQNLNARDIQQGILMIRIAGVGRFALDFLSGRLTGEGAGRLVKSATGEFLGGFFQPLQTLRDAVAGWDEEERKFRDTRQAPLVGPAMVRIPGAGRLLPEAVSPTRTGARESESPWLRQLTGFSVSSKNALEARLADINFDAATLYPRLGNPRANWLVTGELGKIAEEIGPALLRRLDDEARDMRREGRSEAEIKEVQRLRVSEAYGHWKKLAMNRARAKDPALFQRVKTEGASGKRRVVLIRSGRKDGRGK